jgi:hypothetical protein
MHVVRELTFEPHNMMPPDWRPVGQLELSAEKMKPCEAVWCDDVTAGWLLLQ